MKAEAMKIIEMVDGDKITCEECSHNGNLIKRFNYLGFTRGLFRSIKCKNR